MVRQAKKFTWKSIYNQIFLPGMISPKMMAEVGCGCNQNFFSSQGYNRMQHRQSTEEAVEGRYLKPRPSSFLLLHCRTIVQQYDKISTFYKFFNRPMHRGAFCQFFFQLIYYYGSNESTGKNWNNPSLCNALQLQWQQS